MLTERAEILPRGAAVVGRYLVLSLLGQERMGRVYAAFDPQLDRKVALKLLQGTEEGATSPELRQRLVREAQATAKLAHPNVIAVYDAGTDGDRVFVAMELVDGTSARRWLDTAGGQRPWREVLQVFIAAGRGLAAAHAAGLAHQDFSADKILIGQDGRVRVSDFGLALPRGESAGPRFDQLGFCTALYAALYGAPPAAGAFPPRAGAGGERVPVAVRRALARGLQAKPEERFPSMDALLAELDRAAGTSWRRWAGGLAAGVLLCAMAGGAWAWVRSQRLLCSGAERYLAGVWDPELAGQGERAFQATRLPYAGSSWATTRAALDRFGKAWVAMRTEACEATRLHGEQSEETLALRVSCLDERLRHLSALSHLFAAADAEVVPKAVDAVARLGGLELCADVPALRRPVRPPADPAARVRVGAVRVKLAEATARLDAGKVSAALELLEPAAAEAAKLDYLPLHAEALLQLGLARDVAARYPEAEQALKDAFFAAYRSKHDSAAALAAIHLVGTLGNRLRRFPEAHHWEQVGAALVRQVGGNAELVGKLESNVGLLYYQEQRYAEAITHERHALELCQTSAGAEDALCGNAYNNLGMALRYQGEHEQAREAYLRAVAIREKTLGLEHPVVGMTYNNLGNLLGDYKSYDEGLPYLRKAQQIFERSLGADHPYVATVLANMGSVLIQVKRHAEALEAARRALEIYAKRLPPDHPNFIIPLQVTGESLLSLGHAAEAIEPLERAARLAQPDKTRGEVRASVTFVLAQALWHARHDGRRARALALEAKAVIQEDKTVRDSAQFVSAVDALLAKLPRR